MNKLLIPIMIILLMISSVFALPEGINPEKVINIQSKNMFFASMFDFFGSLFQVQAIRSFETTSSGCQIGGCYNGYKITSYSGVRCYYDKEQSCGTPSVPPSTPSVPPSIQQPPSPKSGCTVYTSTGKSCSMKDCVVSGSGFKVTLGEYITSWMYQSYTLAMTQCSDKICSSCSFSSGYECDSIDNEGCSDTERCFGGSCQSLNCPTGKHAENHNCIYDAVADECSSDNDCSSSQLCKNGDCICRPDWKKGAWGECINNKQVRAVWDARSCCALGDNCDISSKPFTEQSCVCGPTFKSGDTALNKFRCTSAGNTEEQYSCSAGGSYWLPRQDCGGKGCEDGKCKTCTYACGNKCVNLCTVSCTVGYHEESVEALDACEDNSCYAKNKCVADAVKECGDGICDVGEDYDNCKEDCHGSCDDDLGGSCRSQCFDGEEGKSKASMTLENGCVLTYYCCVSTAVCSNDKVESGEACDGTDLDDSTCESINAGTGILKCSSDCKSFDKSGCSKGCSGDTPYTCPDDSCAKDMSGCGIVTKCETVDKPNQKCEWWNCDVGETNLGDLDCATGYSCCEIKPCDPKTPYRCEDKSCAVDKDSCVAPEKTKEIKKGEDIGVPMTLDEWNRVVGAKDYNSIMDSECYVGSDCGTRVGYKVSCEINPSVKAMNEEAHEKNCKLYGGITASIAFLATMFTAGGAALTGAATTLSVLGLSIPFTWPLVAVTAITGAGLSVGSYIACKAAADGLPGTCRAVSEGVLGWLEGTYCLTPNFCVPNWAFLAVGIFLLLLLFMRPKGGS